MFSEKLHNSTKSFIKRNSTTEKSNAENIINKKHEFNTPIRSQVSLCENMPLERATMFEKNIPS